MNEHIDPLEVELAAMQPREPSSELKSRIAERLAADNPAISPTSRKPIARWLAIQAMYAAALATSLVVAALLWRGQRTTIVELPRDRDEQPTAPLASALNDSLPSVWATGLVDRTSRHSFSSFFAMRTCHYRSDSTRS